VLTTAQVRTRKAKRALASRGLTEAVTWSFISKPQAELFGGGKPELALANPIAAELSDMRPSLIPGLVAAAQKNADRGFPDTALFEVGQIFTGDKPEDQFMAATGVRRAMAKASGAGRHWSSKSADVDAFDAKADALAMLAAAGAPRRQCRWCPAARPGFTPAAPAPSRSDRRTFSAISASCIRARLRRSTPRARWSPSRSSLSASPKGKAKATRAKAVLELSAFQPVTRDFAFVVDRAVKAADIVRAAQNVDRKLISGVSVFDLYEGQGIGAGKKSVAIAVTIQPRDKTMTDQEIDALGAKIVAEVSKRTGGVLRA
jgi:phenylalanyl-tRNA synthetase beta chain